MAGLARSLGFRFEITKARFPISSNSTSSQTGEANMGNLHQSFQQSSLRETYHKHARDKL